MIKYVSTAVALKCFSSTALTRKVYRSLGTRVGNKRRSAGTMPGYYADRVKRMLRLQRQHGIVKDGDRIMELRDRLAAFGGAHLAAVLRHQGGFV
jgi:hypothetical protein